MANITSRIQISLQPLVKLLSDDNGDASGNGDYSQQSKTLFVQPPVAQKWVVTAFNVMVRARGSRELHGYGNINGGLQNGIKIFVRSSTIETPLYTPIFTNGDLISFGDSGNITEFGAGGYSIVLREIIQGSDGIYLDGARGDLFGVTLEDDFSSLDDHRIIFKGFTQGDI